MNGDFHFDSHRRPIKQRWLILPLQHGLQCRGYQERVPIHSARLHHVFAFVDHRVVATNPIRSKKLCSTPNPLTKCCVVHSGQWRCREPVIPFRPVKERKIKIANTATNRNVTIRASVRSRFNHTHCSPLDLARCVSCCRSFATFSLRTSKPVRQSASISRAISFAHETSGPLARKRKFP
jgi:hypothetical protein